MKFLLFSALLMAVALPAQVFSAERPLTLAQIMERAALAAPEVRISATHVAEEEAKLAGTTVRTLENPELELAAGPRSGDDSSIDVEVAVEIPIELWGRRDKRISVAEATLQREKHAAENVLRQSVNSAVGAYYRLLYAEERLRIVKERKALAEELLRIATERYRAGDAPKFDVNLARTEAIRAESDISAEQGRIALAHAALAQRLGLASGAGLHVEGDLKDRRLFDSLRFGTPHPDRPDLLAAQAEVDASKANVALAKAERRSDVALRLSYKEEGDENVAMAGVSVELPVFNPRRGSIQEARAKNQRAVIAAESRRAAISHEIDGARRAYEAAVESVARLESEGLDLQRENESLAAESYRAGKIDLSILLQVRREALETRREYLDRLLEAAEAGVGLASAIGMFSISN